MTESKSAAEVFTEYFNDESVHVTELGPMIEKLKPIFEADSHSFYVVVFSLVTKMGIERPDFALDMMMSWMRGKGIQVLEVGPEAFEGVSLKSRSS